MNSMPVWPAADLSTRRRSVRALPLLVLALLLFDGAGAALVLAQAWAFLSRDTLAPLGGTIVPGAAGRLRQAGLAGRESEISHLLDRRATALLGRDREAFLATVDPRQPRLRQRQTALFDNLAAVPLSSWEYQLDDGNAFPLSATRRAELGVPGEDGASPAVMGALVRFRYRIKGFDDSPLVARHYLTFTRRDGRWYLAGDTDGAVAGWHTAQELWDFGPVTVRRGTSSLVLGLGQPAVLDRYVRDADAAVSAVTTMWGSHWGRQVVVLVPATQAQMAELLGAPPDEYGQIAAVTTGELGVTSVQTAAERVIINPVAFRQLGPVGRRVVMRHETTHVATRSATRSWTPTWLTEGVADYTGYLGSGVPTQTAVSELSQDLHAGKELGGLPSNEDFSTTRADLAQAYEKGWLACRYIAEVYGRSKLVEFYRAVGESPPGPRAIVAALTRVLGVSEPRFVAAWRNYVAEVTRWKAAQ